MDITGIDAFYNLIDSLEFSPGVCGGRTFKVKNSNGNCVVRLNQLVAKLQIFSREENADQNKIKQIARKIRALDIESSLIDKHSVLTAIKQIFGNWWYGLFNTNKYEVLTQIAGSSSIETQHFELIQKVIPLLKNSNSREATRDFVVIISRHLNGKKADDDEVNVKKLMGQIFLGLWDSELKKRALNFIEAANLIYRSKLPNALSTAVLFKYLPDSLLGGDGLFLTMNEKQMKEARVTATEKLRIESWQRVIDSRLFEEMCKK
jgi:hypothetical protein